MKIFRTQLVGIEVKRREPPLILKIFRKKDPQNCKFTFFDVPIHELIPTTGLVVKFKLQFIMFNMLCIPMYIVSVIYYIGTYLVYNRAVGTRGQDRPTGPPYFGRYFKPIRNMRVGGRLRPPPHNYTTDPPTLI